jgi:putative protease
LECGVDAFIVQDIGVISVLRRAYPGIVLHGSTQLGVHNVRGARVAKSMGLSRVVLSREVTLDDIRKIKESVDIELEVFVQGAMCVAFSGNCYISSLKHNASGNRGLCKQLCRLPYTINSGKDNKQGYILSPRDNCMVDYMKELCDIGVESFKIEGRLRRPGYVGITTRIYREIVDNIEKEKMLNGSRIDELKRELAKVFSRGDFTAGYLSGKDIIDIRFNSHMGEKIGEVVGCEKFKDIYRVYIKTSIKLNSGDGLKFVDKSNKITTLGVGNVENTGNKIVVYGKNHVEIASVVYRTLDSEFENNIENNSRRRKVNVSVKLKIGQPIELRLMCDGIDICCSGAVVQSAKSRPLDEESVKAQVTKFDDDAFEVGDCLVMVDEGVFLAVSELNRVRRDGIAQLKSQILNSYKLPIRYNSEWTNRESCELNCSYDNIAIVDEFKNISLLRDKYQALALSPTIYSLEVVKKFYSKYKKYFNENMIINLPIVAMDRDLEIIDDIVKFAIDNDIILIANNIYALDYISNGARVWAGANMNIVNDYTSGALKKYGVSECVSTIEKWTSVRGEYYKMCKGRRVLMTMAHCPMKTMYHNNCVDCKYRGELKLKSEGADYSIRRNKVSNCYFELVDGYVEDRNAPYKIDDLRGLNV